MSAIEFRYLQQGASHSKIIKMEKQQQEPGDRHGINTAGWTVPLSDSVSHCLVLYSQSEARIQPCKHLWLTLVFSAHTDGVISGHMIRVQTLNRGGEVFNDIIIMVPPCGKWTSGYVGSLQSTDQRFEPATVSPTASFSSCCGCRWRYTGLVT